MKVEAALSWVCISFGRVLKVSFLDKARLGGVVVACSCALLLESFSQAVGLPYLKVEVALFWECVSFDRFFGSQFSEKHMMGVGVFCNCVENSQRWGVNCRKICKNR